MCTASWLRRDGRLHLFFNRDELRSREPAAPPETHRRKAVAWIAPADGRAGGTWIAATDRGLALALLNRSDGTTPEERVSRGHLIPELVTAGDAGALEAALAGLPLERLAPFRLLALWRRHADGAIASWDGAGELSWERVDADLGLLCSSGLGDARASAERGRTWERFRAERTPWGLDDHRVFHRDHSPERSAWSVCVHRPEARSVSFTEIELAPAGVLLAYRDGSPCEEGPVVERRLESARPAAS